MTREQRLQLAHLCGLETSYDQSKYIFRPVGTATEIEIARTDSKEVSGYANGVTRLQGHYRGIDCHSHALPENVEQAIDQLLLDRVHQIENKMGATHGQIRDILKEMKYV